MTETLTYGYPSESPQQELSNEYQYDRVYMVFKNRCIFVLWIKVALAFEGLKTNLLLHSTTGISTSRKMCNPFMHRRSSRKCPLNQCLSQDLESGCLKLAVVKFLGAQIFKGDLYFNHKHV